MYKYPELPSGRGHYPQTRATYSYPLTPSCREPWPISGEHPYPAPSVTAACLLSFSSPPAMQTRTNGSKPGSRSQLKVRIICLTQHASYIYSDWFPHISIDLVEFPVVAIDADESVEIACDVCCLCGRYLYCSWVNISLSLDPLIIWRPMFGHTSERFLLSRSIRCTYSPYSHRYSLLPLLSPPTSMHS